ncbi:Copine_I [Hexamita inflata]|uniref:Copine I n=1 Tax=Hexamita inflata TaxID=28002 RepID=A0AA86QSZ0_9EUKA|nr:Copine I [Hexamita inflata]CAI9948715.1 Copine I [Hexamita inflata]CAI9965444.1 Copine I [Hexamita inflata]
MGGKSSTPIINNSQPQFNQGYRPQQQIQLPDKYKSFDELEQAMRQAGIESIQLALGFDFSKSNEWSGEKSYRKPLHGGDYLNPYLKVLSILEPIIPRFDDDGLIPAFRFGCLDTRDKTVLPLLAPQVPDPHFKGFGELKSAYYQAIQQVKLSGPTTFAPLIYQAIEIEKAYGGRQLIVLIIMTDGDVSNMQLDKQAICEASKYPIAISCVGLGDGPFDKMIEFDDMQGGRAFDNFQFVDFTKLDEASKQCECPDLVLSTAIFNELPDQVKEMKRLGYL